MAFGSNVRKLMDINAICIFINGDYVRNGVSENGLDMDVVFRVLFSFITTPTSVFMNSYAVILEAPNEQLNPLAMLREETRRASNHATVVDCMGVVHAMAVKGRIIPNVANYCNLVSNSSISVSSVLSVYMVYEIFSDLSCPSNSDSDFMIEGMEQIVIDGVLFVAIMREGVSANLVSCVDLHYYGVPKLEGDHLIRDIRP